MDDFDLPEWLEIDKPTVYRAVMEHGRSFRPQSRPKGIRKRADQACFSNCATHPLILGGTLTYVEGFALSSSLDAFWIHHAWLADADGNVVDVTWKEPGEVYIGVPVDKLAVCERLLAVREFGGVLRRPYDWELR